MEDVLALTYKSTYRPSIDIWSYGNIYWLHCPGGQETLISTCSCFYSWNNETIQNSYRMKCPRFWTKCSLLLHNGQNKAVKTESLCRFMSLQMCFWPDDPSWKQPGRGGWSQWMKHALPFFNNFCLKQDIKPPTAPLERLQLYWAAPSYVHDRKIKLYYGLSVLLERNSRDLHRRLKNYLQSF